MSVDVLVVMGIPQEPPSVYILVMVMVEIHSHTHCDHRDTHFQALNAIVDIDHTITETSYD